MDWPGDRLYQSRGVGNYRSYDSGSNPARCDEISRGGCMSRSVNLRKKARGRECQVRIPGYCNGNPETSVLAHYRMAGTCGTGYKPDDQQAAIACNGCHDAIDGRTKTTDYTHDELRLMHAEGVLRTQAIWRREGFI
ncbi:conserved bacteriophage protein [Erwinia sp. Ejp617]|nr:conserved bacteriophage protein [Erwinia sp. Ejp617]